MDRAICVIVKAGEQSQEAPTYIEWAVDEIEYFELDDEATVALEEALGLVDDLEGLF